MKIKLNPDKKTVKEIRQELKVNNGYCPCKLIQDTDTKCMCKEFRESATAGYCHCGLYFKTKDKNTE